MLVHLWDKVHTGAAKAPVLQPEEEEEEGNLEEEEDTLGAETERRYDVAQLERERADREMARVLSEQGGYRPQASVLNALWSLGVNQISLNSSRNPAASVWSGGANASLDPAVGL